MKNGKLPKSMMKMLMLGHELTFAARDGERSLFIKVDETSCHSSTATEHKEVKNNCSLISLGG